MKIDLLSFISEGGFMNMFHLKGEKYLVNFLSPSWIDHFRKNRVYCFQTNIGLLEISMRKYEQIDIDKNLTNSIIFFLYEREYLQRSFLENQYKSNIVKVEKNEFEDYIMLLNRTRLYFKDDLLSCIVTFFDNVLE